MATINGTSGNDTRNGTAAADRINGLGGNDTLNGLAGNDTLVGGDGDDFYLITANPGTDRIMEGYNQGTDTVLSVISYALGANLENLKLTGAGAINGTGNALDNEITGNSGANVLNGRGGDDVLTGGGGNDTYVVDSEGDVVTEGAGASGTDTVRSHVDYVLTQANIENLTLVGPGSKDGTGNALANVLVGNNDSNILSGLNGADTLNGGLGDDVLDGGANADAMSGGGGDDVYIVDNAGDTVTERVGRGHDVVESSAAVFTLPAWVEDLLLTGSGAIDGTGNFLANTIVGNNNANEIRGEGGADLLVGRGGNDDYFIDALDTVIEESGGGSDTFHVGFSYTLDAAAEVENVTLTGEGNFTATGSVFNNVLTGNIGDNLLEGAEGDDTLNGGSGFDTLRGGDGNDVLQWDGSGFQADGGSDADTLRTLNGLPLDLRGIGEDGVYKSIEVLDLASTNQVFLGHGDVAAISGTDMLHIKGGAGDIVDTSGLWVNNGTVEDDLVTYTEFQSGDEFLRIQAGIDISGITEATVNLQLAALNGANGFQISGETMDDRAGRVSDAGDVNADGYGDLLIGAFVADPHGASSGAAYLVFGQATGFSSNLDLSALNGANGFQMSGEAGDDLAGRSVSAAGDVNGDGYADLLIGATGVDAPESGTGAAYVVFGRATGFDPVLELSALGGTTGFQISGDEDGDYAGFSVSGAGDVNGDGYADLVIGAPYADPHAQHSGITYVVFGASTLGADIDLSSLDGNAGFRVTGDENLSRFGFSVSSAGDVDGDGFDDLLIGAMLASPNGSQSGESYVVFGGSALASNLELTALDGINGFRISGEAVNDTSGVSVSSAGDVNGDGYADLLIGATGVDAGASATGAAYVVFGADTGFGSSLDLSALNGANGFQISGELENDSAGFSVSSAGDVNGDGYDDVLIGAYNADTNGSNAGATYVVFGASSFNPNLALSALNGVSGFQISGEAGGDFSGFSVSSAGDVDGDGFDDIFVGAVDADSHGTESGASYVIYGRDFRDEHDPLLVGNDGDNLLGFSTPGGHVIIGGAGDDTMFGGSGADVYRGGEGDDRIVIGGADFFDVSGGAGRDTLAVEGGTDLDLGVIADSKLTGIEVIDLDSLGGTNTLTLTVMELLELSDTSNTLVVDGGVSDHVTIDGTWFDLGSIEGYSVYQLSTGAARLEVAAGVGVDIGIT
jgi:Ca2+-binding RTX toxin-like protein